MLRRDLVPAFLSTVPVAIVTYLASWTGWILSDDGTGGYFRDWAATEGKGGSWTWLPDWLRSLWHYETEVYEFHVGLTSAPHLRVEPVELAGPRPPRLVLLRVARSPARTAARPTPAGKCAREVLALGTPLLWWAACFALLYVLCRWLFRRDWRAGAIACGVAAGYLPWFIYQERTIFFFYAVVFVPFLCLAVAMMIGAHRSGPPGSAERRRAVGRGRRGRAGPADRLELHLLLAPLHGPADPDGHLAGPDVAGHLGVMA